MYGMRLEEARAYVGGRGDKGRSVKTELAETAALEHQCWVRASEQKDGRGEDDNVDSIGYRSKAFTNDQMVVTVQSRPLEIAALDELFEELHPGSVDSPYPTSCFKEHMGGGPGRAMRVHRRSFSSFECLGVALNRNDAFKVARGVDVVPEPHTLALPPQRENVHHRESGARCLSTLASPPLAGLAPQLMRHAASSTVPRTPLMTGSHRL
ncbi:hypothetical protein R3P38DRAFT_2786594 [Favolaschia claudopus]|uniref:Uncharacterized protein n=1 Tax=Favolaschia claudopus TaxID=2862362 RepID=A0AAW0ASQ4_9AGAR